MNNKEGYQRRRRRFYAIIECLKEGMDTKQIAEELGVARRTIQKDIRFILENQKK